MMEIKYYPLSLQGQGSFDSGRILENKPIGFPGEGSALRPYSSLFYWAHACSEKGGLIDEHPHQGFEILSFVLEGEIEHYDSQLRSWKKLYAGDVQIIRAGSGITHAERLLPGSAIFQIWFDPGLRESLGRPASYSDYPAASFPVERREGREITVYKGESAPLLMSSEVASIKMYTFEESNHFIEVAEGNVYSCYLRNGVLKLGNIDLAEHEFLTIRTENAGMLPFSGHGNLFVVESPEKLSYTAYHERLAYS